MGSEDVTLRGDETTFRGRAVEETLTPLDHLGRFVVLERIGVGGSGAVYRAYDSQLDRSVAIKVLHPGAATLRLLAEARAMAKLHHPNVVTVHDVGEADDGVWLAMEYVEGGTLRRWLDAERRTPAAILSVFRHAGAGLAAAHRQGIVHRDFKPDNVLLHLCGRPAVTDFGLARAELDQDAALRASTAEGIDVTARSGLAGTPAYMSPEQFEGRVVGAASDQFSFGVALFEALCGRRPFAGTTVPELCEQVVRGRFEFPADPAVPAWLRRVLERMLQRDPADRFESMGAAVEALDREPVRRRRRLFAGGAVVALLAGGTGALSSSTAPSCDAGAAEAQAVWNPGRRAEIEEAVARANLGSRAGPLLPALDRLDVWTRDWAAAHDDTCAATHERGVQSAARLDARTRCLQVQLEHVAALRDELMQPDPTMLARAFRAATDLPKPGACEAPGEPIVVSDAEREAQRWVARAEVRNELGRYAQGLDATEAGLAALGTEPSPLRVRLRASEGQLARRSGDPERAQAALEDALRSHASAPNLRFAAEAWLDLSILWAETLDEPDHALGTLLAAEVAVRALDDPTFERRLESTRGVVFQYANRIDEAVAALERAVALARNDGDPAVLGVVQGNLGNALFEAGRYGEALAAYDAALLADRRGLPKEHPDLVLDVQNRSRALQALGRNEEAEAELRGAVELGEKVFGPDSERLGGLHLNLGVALKGQMKLEQARTHIQRASEIWSKVHPPEHRYFDIVDNNLGVIANDMGENEVALRHYRAFRQRTAKREGDRSPRVAIALGNEATALHNLGRFEEAVTLHRESLEIRNETLEPEHPDLGYALVGLARALLEVGNFEEALEHAEHARVVRERAKVGPAEMYLTYITLAEAAVGADTSRLDPARAWARAAAAAFERTGLPSEDAVELRAFETRYGLPSRE